MKLKLVALAAIALALGGCGIVQCAAGKTVTQNVTIGSDWVGALIVIAALVAMVVLAIAAMKLGGIQNLE